MSRSNLAIVFGPTLFGFQTVPTPNTNGTVNGNGAGTFAVPDTAMQNKVMGLCAQVYSLLMHVQAIETILEHYTDIFVEEGDES